jgi:hypothetical protein
VRQRAFIDALILALVSGLRLQPRGLLAFVYTLYRYARGKCDRYTFSMLFRASAVTVLDIGPTVKTIKVNASHL